MISKERVLVILFCIAVAHLTLFYQIGELPLLGSDEPRYAGIAEEMFQRGDYVTPVLEGKPWLEKTPLVYWLVILSYNTFGVSEWSARLPNASVSLLCAVALLFFARTVLSTRVGILSFLILLTSGMYVTYARAASTDMPLAVCYSSAMMAGYLAYRTRGIAWAGIAGLCLAGAVLSKGPVAIALFLGVFCVFFLIVDEFGVSLNQLLVGGLTFLAVGVPWFWLVWKANGENFVMTFWVNHHVARFVTDLHHHSRPVWFYIPVLLVGFFPWVFFMGSSFKRIWRERFALNEPEYQLSLFVLLWACLPFLFFTASSSKLPGYILPILPALSLLVASEWDRHIKREVAVHAAMKIQLALVGAFCLVLALTLVFGFYLVYQSPATGFVTAFPLVALTLWGRLEYRRRRPANLFITLVAGMTLTLAALYWAASPVIGVYHSSREIVRTAGPFLADDSPLILYRYFHHTARYYTDYRTTPDSVNDLSELQEYMSKHPQSSYLLLTKKGGYEELLSLIRAQLVSRRGNLYLVKVDKDPEG